MGRQVRRSYRKFYEVRLADEVVYIVVFIVVFMKVGQKAKWYLKSKAGEFAERQSLKSNLS